MGCISRFVDQDHLGMLSLLGKMVSCDEDIDIDICKSSVFKTMLRSLSISLFFLLDHSSSTFSNIENSDRETQISLGIFFCITDIPSSTRNATIKFPGKTLYDNVVWKCCNETYE